MGEERLSSVLKHLCSGICMNFLLVFDLVDFARYGPPFLTLAKVLRACQVALEILSCSIWTECLQYRFQLRFILLL